MPNLPDRHRDIYLHLQAEINLAKIHPDMPRSHTRRTIGTHHHLRCNAFPVSELYSCVPSILAHGSHRSSLKQNCAISHGATP